MSCFRVIRHTLVRLSVTLKSKIYMFLSSYHHKRYEIHMTFESLRETGVEVGCKVVCRSTAALWSVLFMLSHRWLSGVFHGSLAV